MSIIRENKSIIEFGSIEKSSFHSLLLNEYSNSKKVIMVDEHTHDHCLEYMITTFEELAEAEIMLLPAGEENKVMEVCFQVWNALTEYEIGRKDLIINLGGGVVTDMGGFISAIYKRGVDFVHVPTSLLGMVDASIGGKTGIDLGTFKNQLGVFVDPIKIFIDPIFLGTLPEDELWNGYAEILKHALISDRNYWDGIKVIDSAEALKKIDLIMTAALIKYDIVKRDPREQGERKLLNFGHTIGHAIEGLLLEREETIPHGYAVAIGILLESRLSNRLGILTDQDLSEIELVLGRYPKLQLMEEDVPELIAIMRNDKKNSAGKIKGVLIHQIGRCEYDFTFEEALVEQILVESLVP
jgi:3-dehydroquinate synthase